MPVGIDTHEKGSRLLERIAPDVVPVAIPAAPEEARGIAGKIAYLLSGDHAELAGAAEVHARLVDELPAALARAFGDRDAAALLDVHQALFAIYESSFVNPLSPFARHEHAPWLAAPRRRIEETWMEHEAAVIGELLPAEATWRDADALCAWFEEHAARQTELDRRVVAYLEHEATLDDFAFFILSDAHLNYRFYDALALAQLHYSEQVKGELSHHMWEECGAGEVSGAHTVKFTRTLGSLAGRVPAVGAVFETIRGDGLGVPVWDDWRPYAGYNAYLCFGMNRRYLFRSLGSLAMPELFDPGRDAALVRGLSRLGLDPYRDFVYYVDHVDMDAGHGPSWLSGVIAPIARLQPRAGYELAFGGAFRMESMRRYNAYLAARLGVSA
jgi:hypothetical protein